MSRKRQAVEQMVLEFFKTATPEVAEAILRLSIAAVKERRPMQTSQPRIRRFKKSDSGIRLEGTEGYTVTENGKGKMTASTVPE